MIMEINNETLLFLFVFIRDYVSISKDTYLVCKRNLWSLEGLTYTSMIVAASKNIDQPILLLGYMREILIRKSENILLCYTYT